MASWVVSLCRDDCRSSSKSFTNRVPFFTNLPSGKLIFTTRPATSFFSSTSSKASNDPETEISLISKLGFTIMASTFFSTFPLSPRLSFSLDFVKASFRKKATSASITKAIHRVDFFFIEQFLNMYILASPTPPMEGLKTKLVLSLIN